MLIILNLAIVSYMSKAHFKNLIAFTRQTFFQGNLSNIDIYQSIFSVMYNR